FNVYIKVMRGFFVFGLRNNALICVPYIYRYAVAVGMRISTVKCVNATSYDGKRSQLDKMNIDIKICGVILTILAGNQYIFSNFGIANFQFYILFAKELQFRSIVHNQCIDF